MASRKTSKKTARKTAGKAAKKAGKRTGRKTSRAGGERSSGGAAAGGRAAAGRRYWLFKSEPDVYGWDHFVQDGRTFWHGVRNYQARNLLRDEIRVGDGVLFYHSNASPPAVVGVARVVKAGYPDATAQDPKSEYHDPAATPDDPRWYVVDIAPVEPLAAPLDRETLKGVPALRDMVLLQRGSRLSVQPVTAAEWRAICELGKVEGRW